MFYPITIDDKKIKYRYFLKKELSFFTIKGESFVLLIVFLLM